MSKPLPREFYRRNSLTVARELLGARLVREYEGQRLSGMIVETEAYFGPDDSASHASKGRTARTEVMFGEAGYSYVYLIYGMYHMFNVVTFEPEVAGAVLIRALRPLTGVDVMQQLRGGQKQLTCGPGKLCRALAIRSDLNGLDLTLGRQVWIEPHETLADDQIIAGPRVGIDYAQPEHRKAPWRLRVRP